MLKIGLTGGIGSGKSTVARLFNQIGIQSIDTDQIGRELLQPGRPLLNQIRQQWGDSFFNDQYLDRAKLRKHIFQHAEARQQLEQWMHPAIRAEMQARIAQIQGPYLLIEIPLLFEKGWQNEVDRVLLVDAPIQLQIKRVMERDGISQEQVSQIIAQQMSREQKRQRADDLILNQADLNALKKQVEYWHSVYIDDSNR